MVCKLIYFIVSCSLIVNIILLLLLPFESCLNRKVEIIIKSLPLLIEHIESSLRNNLLVHQCAVLHSIGVN
jgi:hypothetical protein